MHTNFVSRLVTIGQLVEDLELIAKATHEQEWRSRIEFLPLG